MGQENVEQIVGRLVTDEGLRRSFAEDPQATLLTLMREGLTLNACEQRAILAIELSRIERFAEALDPCIQKIELPRGES